MRILSVDYGKKRTGFAVTDPVQIVADGLVTVPTSELLSFLKDYCSREEVETIVIGRPTQSDGTPSENLQRVLSFAGRLKKVVPGIPIEWYDERYTSVLAHRTILDSGKGKMARRDKALVDKVSATIILQDYMESRKNRTGQP